jgi:hypothetical protein
MRNLLIPCVVAASLAGCGGSSELTCEVLKDPSNCWAEAALALKECFPADATGVLAADRGSCTFDEGTVVVFDSPLPTDDWDLEELAFDVERDGEPCARFVDTFRNRMELTTEGRMVVAELHAGSEFHVHCPGGPTYESSFSALFDCAAEGAPPPTDGFTVEPNVVEFMISSITTPGLIFTCAPAP